MNDDESQRTALTLEMLALRIDELERRIAIHRDYQERAVVAAAEEITRRLESMNQFRDQLREQAAGFLSRTEYQLHHDALCANLANIEERLSERLSAQEQLSTSWTSKIWVVITLATLLGGLFGHIIGQLFDKLKG